MYLPVAAAFVKKTKKRSIVVTGSGRWVRLEIDSCATRTRGKQGYVARYTAVSCPAERRTRLPGVEDNLVFLDRRPLSTGCNTYRSVGGEPCF